jgi:hypothetical protein
MSMTQLVICSAFGFIAAQGILFGLKQLVGWVRHDAVRKRILALLGTRSSGSLRDFCKYAALVGGSAALITFGVWATVDYLAAKSERGAALANALDPPPPLPAPDSRDSQDDPAEEPVAAPSVSAATSRPVAPIRMAAAQPKVSVPAPAADDAYNDPDFKVHRASRHAQSLKDKLLERSEAKARAELLSETQQHLRRSQYDCEAADRAGKYVKADLDVWGFATWQARHFPVDSYKGATLAQCKDIKNVIDPAALDLRTTVAQQKAP